MADNTRIVKKGQSLWDVAAEHYGSVDAVQQLILDNPAKVSFATKPTPGAELVVGTPFNQSLVAMFAEEIIKPASASEEKDWLLTNGVWDDVGVWDDWGNWNDN